MSLKKVLRLTGVYSRSSRLISKNNFRMFREKRLEAYGIYVLALALGVLGGSAIGYLYLIVPDPAAQGLFRQAISEFFVGLPTLCIMFTLFLTMMFQLQQSGAKVSVQPVYWFPVTWGEHTAASVLSSTLTGSLWAAILLCSAVVAVSIPAGLLPLAVLTSIGIFMCMALAAITVDMFKALQMSISGAIMKVAGKTAVWVRFFGILILITAVYIAYFSIVQSSIIVVFNAIGDGQLAVWFIPYVWPGLSLYAFSQGLWTEAALFFAGAAVFAAVLFMAAVRLNARYGLYDAPSIRISTAYVPRVGLLGRLGLPAAESAIVKKDFKAFTRRTELIYVFIMPIVILVATFMPLVMGGRGIGQEDQVMTNMYFFLYLMLLPAPAMATTFGISVVGSEGERLWLIKASPVSKMSFVRAKFAFPAIVCTAIVLICEAAGILIFGPSLRTAATGMLEALLVSYTVLAVALTCGIAGADFREVPRPRMIRSEWSLASMLLAAIAALLVLMPAIVYAIPATIGPMFGLSGINGVFLYAAWLLSAAIALVIGFISYKLSLSYASKILDAE